jgi:prenyltransferase beta subunit
MSLRLEMLQVARLAPRALDDAAALVESFIMSQWNADGGVKDRAGVSDLYYTVFGLESLVAFQRPTPASVRGYLTTFAAGESLDFVHRCCLARGWAIVGLSEFRQRSALEAALHAQRSSDGGFSSKPGEASGSAYAAYLALAALQDLGSALPPAAEVVPALHRLRSADGGYANTHGAAQGTTPATVSVVMALHAYRHRADQAVVHWLRARQQLPAGGFLAHPQAPIPDLLSTATALHALACLEQVLERDRTEAGLDFVDSLWTNHGSFHGHWAEDVLDAEYTYYGLLALGHLSL